MGGKRDYAFPSGLGGQVRLLLLQRNRAQTLNCEQKKREEHDEAAEMQVYKNLKSKHDSNGNKHFIGRELKLKKKCLSLENILF